jgi:hypothetical protein
MSSADALLAPGVPPGFRRIDQLIVFSRHQLPCVAQGYSRRLRATADNPAPTRMAGVASITSPVSRGRRGR